MTTRQHTTTAHSFTVTALAADGRGSLAGHAMTCTCGTVQRTSLSADQAARDGHEHLSWHGRTGR